MDEHILYSDGTPCRIAWSIRTKGHTLNAWRNQAEIYRDKVSLVQSRFMALHVGLFWGIGVFAIRNGDAVRIMLDDDSMISHIQSGSSGDPFIDNRIRFINMLIETRHLNTSLVQISTDENIASALL